MKQGPGGTRSMAPVSDANKREFYEALNLEEAKYWLNKGAYSMQGTIAMQWLADYLISLLESHEEAMETLKAKQVSAESTMITMDKTITKLEYGIGILITLLIGLIVAVVAPLVVMHFQAPKP